MANYATNKMKFFGSEEEINKLKKICFNSETSNPFDFNKIIPLDSDNSDEAKIKWGVPCVPEIIDQSKAWVDNKITFDTKWIAPNLLIKKISSDFPDLFIENYWEEEGNDIFEYQLWKAGELKINEDWSENHSSIVSQEKITLQNGDIDYTNVDKIWYDETLPNLIAVKRSLFLK